jgi:hypothetical protein
MLAMIAKRLSHTVFIAAVAALMVGGSGDRALAQSEAVPSFERCRALPNPADRLRCFEGASARQVQRPNTASESLGTWRLVRTTNSGGGADAVSISQTADLLRSDLDLAGLMLRCADSQVEVLIVVLRPFPPRARPQVTVSAGEKDAQFAATVIPPGAALLLPPDAAALANGPWRSLAELAVTIDDEQMPVRGVISLAGLASAIKVLLANCSQ